jgi:CYTH domain-containing protein
MIPSWQKGKYNLTEREKRFLLVTLPDGLDTTYRHIEDLYFQDTRLRLRKITDAVGQLLELKLTQKFLNRDQAASERKITNLYLSQTEYELFAKLPGRTLHKRRYSYEAWGRLYSIDVFERHLAGLMLAEVEYAQHDPIPAIPPFALKEVTDDVFFTGGHLASLSEAEFLKDFQGYILGNNRNPLG